MILKIKEYYMGNTLVYHPFGKQHGVLIYRGILTEEVLNSGALELC